MYDSEARNVKNLSIYVAGIPSQASRSEIKKYFSQFGSIERVVTFEDKGRRSIFTGDDRMPIRGFCIVTPRSKHTFDRILEHSEHRFGDRILACRKYVNGLELQQQNKLLNDRRVILKQVPLSIEEKTLKKTLELIGGQIEMFFAFRPDTELKRQRKHLTCSAMFSDSRGAQELIDIGSIPGPNGRPISVRKYMHNSRTTFDEYKDPGSDHLKVKTTSSASANDWNWTTLSHQSRKTDQTPYFEGQLQQAEKISIHSAEQGNPNTCRLANFHSQKPTAARYYNYRSLMDYYTKRPASDNGAIRINILISRPLYYDQSLPHSYGYPDHQQLN